MATPREMNLTLRAIRGTPKTPLTNSRSIEGQEKASYSSCNLLLQRGLWERFEVERAVGTQQLGFGPELDRHGEAFIVSVSRVR